MAEVQETSLVLEEEDAELAAAADNLDLKRKRLSIAWCVLVVIPRWRILLHLLHGRHLRCRHVPPVSGLQRHHCSP